MFQTHIGFICSLVNISFRLFLKLYFKPINHTSGMNLNMLISFVINEAAEQLGVFRQFFEKKLLAN